VKVPGRSLVTLGFVLYLSCFSAFAIYHVYAENELVDTHGCQIGEWVQHAQIIVFTVVLPYVVMVPVLFRSLMAQCVHPAPQYVSVLLRGPPQIALP
jgi:hypothetical protein